MNIDYPLTDIAYMFDRMRPVTSGFWHLYAINKELGLHHGPGLPKYAHIIAHLTSRDINDGPSSMMWYNIECKIRILRKKGLL